MKYMTRIDDIVVRKYDDIWKALYAGVVDTAAGLAYHEPRGRHLHQRRQARGSQVFLTFYKTYKSINSKSN
jgi:hypothetical protein